MTARCLKEKLTEIRERVPVGKPIVYFDYPVYGNVGDLLIHLATEAILDDGGYEVIDHYNLHNFRAAVTRGIPRDATIVFQGGGNFGDLFPRHQAMREWIIRRFPNHRIVILPQTVYFQDRAKLANSARVFGQHGQIVIFARDHMSREVLVREFSNEVVPMPDVVHHLTGQFDQPVSDARGVLHFIRRDQAGYGRLPSFPLDLSVGDKDIWDWPKFLNVREHLELRLWRLVHYADGFLAHTLKPYLAWRARRDRIIQRAVAFFRRKESVITNRLHGTLLALACNRPVTIGDTGYGKLTAYYDSWLRDCEAVTKIGPDVHLEAMV